MSFDFSSLDLKKVLSAAKGTNAPNQVKISLDSNTGSPKHLGVMPSFPMRRNSIRRSSVSSKGNDSPFMQSVKGSFSPSQCLSPISVASGNLESSRRPSQFSKIGVPLVVVTPSMEQQQPHVPLKGSRFQRFADKVSTPKSLESSQTFTQEDRSEKSFFDEEGTEKETGRRRTLLRRFQTGIVAADHFSEDELIDLACEILKKPKKLRSGKDINILLRYMSNVDFFKKHDLEVAEECLKSMSHISLKAGETVFNIGDVGTTFWVILRGSVGVWLNSDQILGKRENGENAIVKVFREVRTLPKGSAFGELALTDNKPRAASIICKENCDFAVLDKEPFKEILRDSMKKNLFEEINFLAELPLFNGWTFYKLKELFLHSPIISYGRNNPVYDEGDQPEKMYIVKKGTFKILKEIDMDSDSKEDSEVKSLKKKLRAKKMLELAVIGEREIFGEGELMSSEKRKYRVVCDTVGGEIYEINKKEFTNKVAVHTQSKEWLEEFTVSRNKYLEERIKTLTQAAQKRKTYLSPAPGPGSAREVKKFSGLGSPISSPLSTKKKFVIISSTNIDEDFNQEDNITPLLSHPDTKTKKIRASFLGENPKFTSPVPVLREKTELKLESPKHSMMLVKSASHTVATSPNHLDDEKRNMRESFLRSMIQQSNHPKFKNKSSLVVTSPRAKHVKVSSIHDEKHDHGNEIKKIATLKSMNFDDNFGSAVSGTKASLMEGSLVLHERQASLPKTTNNRKSIKYFKSQTSFFPNEEVKKERPKLLPMGSLRLTEEDNPEEDDHLIRLKSFSKLPSVRGSMVQTVRELSGALQKIDKSELKNWAAKISNKIEGGKQSIRTREFDEHKEKEFKQLHTDDKKEKWKKLMEEQGGKNFKKNFYSTDALNLKSAPLAQLRLGSLELHSPKKEGPTSSRNWQEALKPK